MESCQRARAVVQQEETMAIMIQGDPERNRQRIALLEALVRRQHEALAFYADPEIYFAIGFFPDPPAGEFMDDFGETELGVKPGKRARAVLAEGEKWGAGESKPDPVG